MENFWKTVYLLYLQQFWIFIFKLRFPTIGLVDRSFHYLLFELYRAIPRDTNTSHNSSKNSTILSSNISLIITNVIFQTFHSSWKNSSKFLSFLFVNNHPIQFSPFVYITLHHIVKPFRSSTFHRNRLKKKEQSFRFSVYPSLIVSRINSKHSNRTFRKSNAFQRVSKTWQTRICGAKKFLELSDNASPNITAVSAGDSSHSSQGGEEEGLQKGWLLSRTNASRWIVCRRLFFSLSFPPPLSVKRQLLFRRQTTSGNTVDEVDDGWFTVRNWDGISG